MFSSRAEPLQTGTPWEGREQEAGHCSTKATGARQSRSSVCQLPRATLKACCPASALRLYDPYQMHSRLTAPTLTFQKLPQLTHFMRLQINGPLAFVQPTAGQTDFKHNWVQIYDRSHAARRTTGAEEYIDGVPSSRLTLLSSFFMVTRSSDLSEWPVGEMK